MALLFASLHIMAQERITYEYDDLNRLTMVTYPNGQTVTYTYDALGNRMSKKMKGVEVVNPILLGDVNGDGEITVADVTMLVDYILGRTNSNFIIDNADVNEDGKIIVSDVTLLVNLVLRRS